MKFTTILIVALAGALAFGYFQVPIITEAIDTYVLGKAAPQEPLAPTNLYILADGTGSNSSTYAIPQLDPKWIDKIASRISQSTGGNIYVSHIDRNSANNHTHYLKIPYFAPVSTPPSQTNETSFDFKKRKKQWEQNLGNLRRDSMNRADNFLAQKEQFVGSVTELLRKKVYVRSQDNMATDVVGSLNAAITSLSDPSHSDGNNYIVAFSDLVDNSSNAKLQALPDNIAIYALNPVQNSTGEKLLPGIQEVNNVELLAEKIISQ